MSHPDDNPSRHPQELHVERLRFLGEQDGPAERRLKETLTAFFKRDRSVDAAYLARIDFGNETPASVALCLRTRFGPDKGMVEKLGKFFADNFAVQEHMDIVFLHDRQECVLARMCNPFFVSPSPKGGLGV